ncbi:BrnT family toxin [Aurantimonas sp. A2-1-M11]|uniref:BrnT family toxin n=1 Tax=Aurantimonas sp. A2-1-M11 TaxID=3113712 RepID=UPI002F920635
MKFEFDPNKSAANKAKHGFDFEDAQRIWDDPWMIEAPARTDDEPRCLAIGQIGGKHWAAVYVEREGRLRLISVRRARQQEVAFYEGA